jgi:hypothetical protein
LSVSFRAGAQGDSDYPIVLNEEYQDFSIWHASCFVIGKVQRGPNNTARQEGRDPKGCFPPQVIPDERTPANGKQPFSFPGRFFH